MHYPQPALLAYLKTTLHIGLFVIMPFAGYCALQLNIFPPEEVIDFTEPGVNGFEIDYQLFGSQSGAGAASATINYYYCDNSSGTGTCYLIHTRQILLNCNSGSTLCFPSGSLETHYISQASLPNGFDNTCFPGDWYIIGQVVGNTGSSLNTNPTSPVDFASSRPELQPVAISVNPNPAIPGQMLISCTIQNNGPCPAPASQATIWLTPDTGAPILFDIPFLNSGVSVTISVPIEDLDVGVLYDATLTADIFDNIEERNETNNTLTVADVFEIPVPMDIQSFNPNSTLVGSLLTINGTSGVTAQGDFLDVQSVFLGAVELPILGANENTLQVLVPYFVNEDFVTLQTIYGTTVVSPTELTILCSPDFADIEDSSIPAPWVIDSPGDSQTFQVYNGGGGSGSAKSIIMNHWSYSTIGALDYIYIPHICVDNDPNWFLQFDLAYTYYFDGTTIREDNFYIQDILTGDILAFVPGQDLATAPPRTNIFEPAASDWITLELPLASRINAGQTELYLAIITENGNGNALYLDNIRVSNSSILPVEYTALKATTVADGILVDWSTSSEFNNDYFIVQASIDGRTFEEIGRVTGSGSTTSSNNYSFLDRNPHPGINFYRLLQVDYDGTEKLSNIVSASFSDTKNWLNISPNPGNGLIQISTSLSEELDLRISDYTGRIIDNQPFPIGGQLDLSHLPDGIYILHFTSNNTSFSSRYFKKTE